MRSAATIRFGVVLLAVVCSFGSRASAQSKVYYTSLSGELGRANLDGSNPETLVTGLPWTGCLAVDPVGGKVYWIGDGTGEMQRANLDGSDMENIGTVPNPRGIDVDGVRGKVYWTDYSIVHRADLDGANPEVVIGSVASWGVAVDTINAKLYWTAWMDSMIQRSDLDGTNIETLVTGVPSPRSIDLDVAGGKMYWRSDTIAIEPYPQLWRADLDGGNVELLYSLGWNMWVIDDIAVDPLAGKLYWTEQNSYDSGYKRCNLDGTQVEALLPLGAIGLDLLVVPGIPAVSTWGLVFMTILGATAGTLLFRRRHHWVSRPHAARGSIGVSRTARRASTGT